MRGVQPERLYTQILGMVLLILGIIGLLVGETVRVFNLELPHDLIHTVLGIVGVYLGFFNPDLRMDRLYAQATGVLFLLIAAFGAIDPTLFGMLRMSLTPSDHMFHLIIGVVGLAVGFFYNTERAGVFGRATRRI